MTTSTQSLMTASPSDNSRSQWFMRLTSPMLILIMIMLLAAALNFFNIDSIGDANTYYTAAIEAMLQSPSNFFFIAAEPGGSVTIDKPPLGLWIQAISAMFLGVSGFSVVLPQILAGIFSVPLLYTLVKRYFGTGAGLAAALVMAVMPVSVAVQRNNTMDATLIFTLLLAAWMFIKATESGKFKWLLLGGVLVGLGFNIKMMQAFLPLPAFYGLYFLGAKTGWGRKIAYLVATTIVILAVSLSWIIAVDLTPADQRPYMGSSENNSALELAIGYNGIQRLLGGMGGGGSPRTGSVNPTDGGQFTPPTDSDGQQMTPPAGFTPPTDANGQPMTPPYDMTARNGMPNAGGGMFGNEIGSAGVLRLFTQPLDNEIGWLLPFSLFGLGLLIFASRPRLPLVTAHKGVILWGGWLVTEIVFFSAAGFFHAYYLSMLTPPIAALVGIALMRVWHIHQNHKVLAITLLLTSVSATLAFQIVIAAGYTDSLWWALIPLAALLIAVLVLIMARINPRFSRWAGAGFVASAVALVIIPTTWAGATTAQNGGNTTLPAAYSGTSDRMTPQRQNSTQQASADGTMPAQDGGMRGPDGGGTVDADLLAYLQTNTEGMRWMMAVQSSQQGAAYVLETGRGVMYMGGFSGQDPVVDAASLQAYVDAGELRYILSGGRDGGMPNAGGMGANSAVTTWLQESCTVVTEVTTTSGTLYDCAN